MKKIILVATISFMFSCKSKQDDDYDVIVVKIPKFETIQKNVNSDLSNIDSSTKEVTIYNSSTMDKQSDDEYNKALERIDLSGFSKEEIQSIKRDKPVQIWEPYCGQY